MVLSALVGTDAPDTPPSEADQLLTVFQLPPVPRVRASVQLPAPLAVTVFAPATNALGLSVMVAVPEVRVPVHPLARVMVNVPAPPVVDRVRSVDAPTTRPVTSEVMTTPLVIKAWPTTQ